MPRKRFHGLAEDKQRHILMVAEHEFADRGFDGASYNRIIERAGVSKGAMYYYFEDKEDLYTTVLRASTERYLAVVGAEPTPVTTAAQYWQQVEESVRRGARFWRTEPHTAGLVRSFVRAAARGEVSDGIREMRDVYRQTLSLFVGVGQAVGAVRTDLPLDLLIELLLSVGEGMDVWVADHLDELDDDALDALAVQMCDLYRRLAAPLQEVS